jgi:hypothetical protein
LVIAPRVTWKIRASCAGVFSSFDRASWFSTEKWLSSIPLGNALPSRLRASWSAMNISLNSATESGSSDFWSSGGWDFVVT